MTYKVLNSQFIEALLNGDSINDVKNSLDLYCDKWKRQLEQQYQVALLMERILEGPDDNQERIATIEYLKQLKGDNHDD